MAVYSATTKISPEGVMQQAKDTFGEDGLGLSLAGEHDCCVIFEGGGGHVSITAVEEGDRTEVELETREWDYQVKKFMQQL